MELNGGNLENGFKFVVPISRIFFFLVRMAAFFWDFSCTINFYHEVRLVRAGDRLGLELRLWVMHRSTQDWMDGSLIFWVSGSMMFNASAKLGQSGVLLGLTSRINEHRSVFLLTACVQLEARNEEVTNFASDMSDMSQRFAEWISEPRRMTVAVIGQAFARAVCDSKVKQKGRMLQDAFKPKCKNNW